MRAFRADIASGDAILVPAVHKGGHIVAFVVAGTDASNAGHVIFYDNTEASGRVLAHLSVGDMAAGGSPTSVLSLPSGGVNFVNGVYIDITGVTSGSVIVYVR